MNSSEHGDTLNVAEGEVDGACRRALGGRLCVFIFGAEFGVLVLLWYKREAKMVWRFFVLWTKKDAENRARELQRKGQHRIDDEWVRRGSP